MALNSPALFKNVSKPKPKLEYLAIEEKMKVLNMVSKEKSITAIARHFGVNCGIIGRIKKAEDRSRKTAASPFNVSTKKIISPHFNPFILMESALIEWIVECSKTNVFLN